PRRAAGKVSLPRYQRLADAVKRILGHAIERGGTTLRDFLAPDGAPGYFEQELLVYGREGEACRSCGTRLKSARLGQRASVWCPRCPRCTYRWSAATCLRHGKPTAWGSRRRIADAQGLHGRDAFNCQAS